MDEPPSPLINHVFLRRGTLYLNLQLKNGTPFTHVVIANEQLREDARLRGGSLIKPCAIVPGAEKISNRCNIE